MRVHADYDHDTVNAILFDSYEIASSESIGLSACVSITRTEFVWNVDCAQWSNWIMVF